jgi:hypothetical protein
MTSTTQHVPNEWKEFVACFNASGVEYLLVGGHAVAFHGVPRLTKDLDFFVRQTEENARRIVEALRNFGFAGLHVRVEDLMKPNSMILLGHPPLRIDLLATIDGVEFDQAWEAKELSTFEGHSVWVISKSDLVQNKRTAGRPQDIADASRLEQLDADE